MKFKNIRAVFKVKEDTDFKNKKFHKDRSDFIFEVKRHPSGSFHYGDRSAHTIEIINHKEIMGNYYDTRYDMIDDEKEEWIKFWQNYIERTYGLKLELTEYEESEEEIED